MALKKKIAHNIDKQVLVTLEGDDAFLDAFCMSRGGSITSLDEHLAALPGDNPNKRELERLRQKVSDAVQRGDLDALDGWFHALLIGLKAAVKTIPLALKGERFMPGHEHPGPIRRKVASMLKTNPDLKNPGLWDMIAANPPRGWALYDNKRLGKYAEGPKAGQGMKYGRFCTICGEERKKIKG